MRYVIPTVAMILALAFPAAAAADPPEREVYGPSDPFETSVACGFPVVIEEHPEARAIARTWVQDDGSVRELWTAPRIGKTVTNPVNGKQVTANGGGVQKFITAPDGSYTMTSTGQTVWGVRHPMTGELGFFLITGRMVATFDVNGAFESFELSGGKIEALCPQLD